MMANNEKRKTELENTENKENDSTGLNMPRWIHDKEENPAYFGGIKRSRPAFAAIAATMQIGRNQFAQDAVRK